MFNRLAIVKRFTSIPVLAIACASSYGQGLAVLRYADEGGKEEKFTPGFKAGKFSFYPSVTVLTFFESPLSRQVSDSDFVMAIAPTFEVRYPEPISEETGLKLTYTPVYNRYLINSEFSTFDHSVNFVAIKSFPRITARLSNSFKKETEVFFEDGERAEELSFNILASLAYSISEKLDYTLAPALSYRDYERATLFGNTTWSLQNALNYNFSPKTTAGLIVTPGIREVENAGSYSFERVQANINHSPSVKLSFGASVGATFWQAPGGGNDIHPIFTLSSSYEFTEKTSLRLGLMRFDDISAVRTNQSHITSQLAGLIRHKLTDKVNLSFQAGYRTTEYFVTGGGGGSTSRKTSGFHTAINANYAISEHWNAGFFYNFRHDELVTVNDTFTRHRTGVSITYSF